MIHFDLRDMAWRTRHKVDLCQFVSWKSPTKYVFSGPYAVFWPVREERMRVFRLVLASIRFFVEAAVKRVIHATEYTIVNSFSAHFGSMVFSG